MIAIASDHAGFALKEEVIKHLTETGVEFEDLGPYNNDSVDYPEYAEKLSNAVVEGKFDKGILICGTGIGMSMAANKVDGIRAACCSDYFSAKATRLHNNANVLCFGERVVGAGLACELVDVFLNTQYEGGRHQHRLDKMHQIEERN